MTRRRVPLRRPRRRRHRRGTGIGRAYALLLAERGAAVVVNDLGGVDGRRRVPTPGRRRTSCAEIVGGGRVGRRRHQRRRRPWPAPTPWSTRPSSSSVASTSSINNAGIIRWAGFPEADARQPGPAPGRAHGRLVQHGPRGLAPHGRSRTTAAIVMTTSSGMFGLPTNAVLRHGQGGGRRPHPQPGHGGVRSTASRSTSSPRRRRPAWPAVPAPAAHDARAGRSYGRLPGPRGLPGDRRDVRRRRRPLRPPVHRHRRRATCTPGPGRPSRTSPHHWAAINDETRLLRPGRPHGAGRLPSWPTCGPQAAERSTDVGRPTRRAGPAPRRRSGRRAAGTGTNRRGGRRSGRRSSAATSGR